VTNPVMQALANARQQERDAEERTLTAAVLERLHMAPPPGDRSHFAAWRTWCAGKGIVDYPALPAAVAVYILSNAALGERLARVVASISAVHQVNGKADPTLSPIVIEALDSVQPPIEAPRGWNAAHRAMWQRLPRGLRIYVRDRENDRDAALRKQMSKQKDSRPNGKSTQQNASPAAAGNADAPIQDR
jgi:hypothetical protein